MKKTISIILSLLIILGTYTVFGASAAVKIKDKKLRAYTAHSFTLSKPESLKYYCKTTNNSKKFISVKFKDNGSTYSVKTVAKKITKGKKPVVNIYYKNSENKVINVRRFRYKVTPMGTVKFKNIKMNVNVSENRTLKNPFAYDYKIKQSASGVAQIISYPFNSGEKHPQFLIKALKEGSTTVRVYLKGVSKKVGEFKVTVGNYKTKINSKCTTLRLKYNSHGSSTFMEGSHFNVKPALMYTHSGAKYSVESDNENVVSIVNGTLIYTTGKGSTYVTVYETINKKTKSIGKIKVKSVAAKMFYVTKQNALFYDGIIFGYDDNVEFLDLASKKTVSLRPTIVKRLLNNSLTNSHFKSSEYKILFKSSNTDIAKVSSSGKVTALKTGETKIIYTINFNDKSSYKNICKINVE